MKTSVLHSLVSLLVIPFLLLVLVSPASAEIIFGDTSPHELELDWARAVNGRVGTREGCGQRNITSIVLDADDNIYVSDSFVGTLEFGFSPGQASLTSERDGMFIARYNASGYLLWALGVNGWHEQVSPSGWRSHEIEDSKILVDSDRNVCVTGTFRGTIDFDPGEGIYNLTSERNGMFIAKYDACGNLLWARAVSGRLEHLAKYRSHEINDCLIALDSQNNVYVTGIFYGTMDFDPGDGIYNLTSERDGMFIAKYDSSGAFLWGCVVPGWTEDLGNYRFTTHEIRDSRIAVDGDGNVHVTGTFWGTLDFDPGERAYNLTSERQGMFVAKYHPAGNLLWAHAVSGWHEQVSPGSWWSHEIRDSQIVSDTQGNMYVTGTFRGTLDFDPAEGIHNLTSERQGMFVAKYDQAGNFLWANAVSGWHEQVSPSGWRSHEIDDSQIALDADTNVYVTGTFYGTLDFDPTHQQYNLTSEREGMFIAKYDTSGNFRWARAVSGWSESVGGGSYILHRIKDSKVASDATGNICIAGTFEGTLDFAPAQRQYDLTGSGMFIAKYRTRSDALNSPPIADAGPDQTLYAAIHSESQVTLDASASRDDDCDLLDYFWTWTVDGHTYEANGVNPKIQLPIGQHIIELVVNDGLVDSEPDEVIITVLLPSEPVMQLTPQTLNCTGKGKFIKAHITLPEDILPEDIDVNTAAVADPPDVESEYIKILAGDTDPVKLEIAFDRQAFCAELTEPGQIEVTVTGFLTTGQYFEATDTITIKNSQSEPKPFNQAQTRRLRLIK